jgi:hypothetical protein
MRSSQFVLAGALLAASVAGHTEPAAARPAAPVADQRIDLGAFGENTNVAADEGLRLGTGANRAAGSLRTGLAVYPLTLAAPSAGFTATVDATVPAGAELAVDVRGRSEAGWSEWTQLPDAALPFRTSEVEVRAMLSAPDGVASPVLRSLTVSPTAARAAEPVDDRASYRVFATREGLVGGTTANGHKITKRDHFVALPSRRGLSGRRGGNYSVRVCASNGRCAWAPVWDVGPWNTRDDYWNPPRLRQSWRDLPRGRPQAQAAYQGGYHGGRDQFGRPVKNPAGIDLADGMFWDGLKLTGNSWVTVTYLWAGSAPWGYVRTGGAPLRVRRGPSTATAMVGTAARFSQVRVECRTGGQSVSGAMGTTSVWYRLADAKYVSAAYVSGVRGAPGC